jgi:hypothetical protein
MGAMSNFSTAVQKRPNQPVRDAIEGLLKEGK